MHVHTYVSPLQRPLTAEENVIRETNLAILNGEEWALQAAAHDMAAFVTDEVVLVPIPSSKGKTDINLKLAQAISDVAHCEVMDILVSNARESQRLRRKSGKRGLGKEDIQTMLKHPYTGTKHVVLIDNVRATGATIDSALAVLSAASYLVYAQAEEILEAAMR